MGDASTVFWADAPHTFDGEFTLADLFAEADNPDEPRRRASAVTAPCARARWTGQAAADTRFFVLASPQCGAYQHPLLAARRALSELAPRLVHFEDIRVVRRYKATPRRRHCSDCSPAWPCKARPTTSRRAWLASGCDRSWKTGPAPGLLNAVQRCRPSRT